MVGLIKACVRVVSRGGRKKHKPSSSPNPKQQQQQPSPAAYVKVACLLGLRVSPSHRYGVTVAMSSAPLHSSFCFFSFHHMRMDVHAHNTMRPFLCSTPTYFLCLPNRAPRSGPTVPAGWPESTAGARTHGSRGAAAAAVTWVEV